MIDELLIIISVELKSVGCNVETTNSYGGLYIVLEIVNIGYISYYHGNDYLLVSRSGVEIAVLRVAFNDFELPAILKFLCLTN